MVQSLRILYSIICSCIQSISSAHSDYLPNNNYSQFQQHDSNSDCTVYLHIPSLSAVEYPVFIDFIFRTSHGPDVDIRTETPDINSMPNSNHKQISTVDKQQSLRHLSRDSLPQPPPASAPQLETKTLLVLCEKRMHLRQFLVEELERQRPKRLTEVRNSLFPPLNVLVVFILDVEFLHIDGDHL